MNFSECDGLHPLCFGSNRGDTDRTVVFEERDWKDFISFLAVGVNPSVLADTSPIFCRTKHPVMLRDTARAEVKSSPLFIADRQ